MDAKTIGELIAQIGIPSFLVLYLIVHWIPKMMDRWDVKITEIIKQFREEMAAERVNHMTISDQIIHNNRLDHEKITAKLEGMENSLRERI